ncbi:hypothetical protein [Candidatus Neptunichlamydia sp. REUL1]|uniref:hypothetical protein n=1 Tax=Candidatus Neptunichlamydia sp. REUL1 TaxID=3064277 RepID=UPI00292F9923|nr:hypothetical protein [Candidatus Neptunochlamydia sp. REUL1]
MEINGDVETNEIDQATLLKMATSDNKEADRKELYLEHLRVITTQAIKSQEKEFSQLSSDIKI